MGSFASFLKRSGIRVTGSDQNVYPPMSEVLARDGVELFHGYLAEHITSQHPKPDLIVIGNVISSSNPEASAAMSSGTPCTSLPEAMEIVMLPKTRNLVVAGTHGKTTTASLLAHVLRANGKDPNWFIGGVSKDLPHSFQVSGLEAGRPFVLEGDEYDTAFWDKVPKFNHYLPDDVILTSVEFDHADIYEDLAAVVRAFEGLMKRIRAGGRLIACLDFPSVASVIRHAQVPAFTYSTRENGSASGARFWIENFQTKQGRIYFDIMDRGTRVETLELQVPGRHNASNALAVWIECRELGLSSQQIRTAIAEFQGVKRRQEERGEVAGVLVIDDFAHHPTAVRETLQALKAKYSGRRLLAVFEPRSATSRRKVFQRDYSEAFLVADQTFICKPFDQSKIAADEQFSSDQLVHDIQQQGSAAELMESPEAGVLLVAQSARSGDLIAVLSNGGFGGFIPKLLDELRNRL
jgi:UDP-N-acetylmuramate: L-alanyl-gamma-D-glutamyl-meso-diaminopimelate ligase